MKITSVLKTLATVFAVALNAIGFTAQAENIPGVAEQPASYFYTGKPYDADLGAYVFNARNYNPEINRWTSADPSGFPDGANANIYVPSPLSECDPDGRRAQKAFSNQAHTINLTVGVQDSTGQFSGMSGWASAVASTWSFSGTDATNGQSLSFSVNITVTQLGSNLTSSQILGTYDNMASPTAAGSRSYVTGGMRQGFWASDASNAVIAHEVDHFMMAPDRYTDNASGVSIPHAGWANTVMGSAASTSTKQDVNLVLTSLGVTTHLFE